MCLPLRWSGWTLQTLRARWTASAAYGLLTGVLFAFGVAKTVSNCSSCPEMPAHVQTLTTTDGRHLLIA